MPLSSALFDVEKLLDAVSSVAYLVPPEKVRAIASRIRRAEVSTAAAALSGVVSTPTASAAVIQLMDAWRENPINAGELASMLLAATHVMAKVSDGQTAELVWTGPTTPFVSARRTEQALLQVISSAEKTLFIVSFVAYDVATIVKAMNEVAARGVVISVLLELARDDGGTITFDASGKMRSLVPSARLYSWRNQSEPHIGGSVHAKIALADDKICFITSANLTGHAMSKNMEAGVLISGGGLPSLLGSHLQALIDTRILSLSP